MKKTAKQFLILIFLFRCSLAISQQNTFYVSLSGNDKWSGRLANPNKNKTDGPFRNFERAKLKIEEINRKGSKNKITICIRRGVYTINEPLRFSEKDGGSETFPVTWKSYQQEKVELTGGKEIKGFKPLSDPNAIKRINKSFHTKIFQVNLKAIGINDFGAITNRGNPGMELFFNGKRMEPARWPNDGWAKIADVPQKGVLVYKGNVPHMRFGIPVGRHYGRFNYEGDRPSKWSDVNNISLHGYWTWDWYDEYLNILSINAATREIFIKPQHSKYGYCKEQRYYAVNVMEELDRPGEWYINRSTGLLLFWPPSSIDGAGVFVSLLSKPLIELNNTASVKIEGISFEYARSSAIIIKGGKNNQVAGCSFSNLGDVAVRIEEGINNGVLSCDIHDIATSGIILSGGDRKNLAAGSNYVVNSNIHDFAQWIRTYQPGIDISGVGNRIANNLIYNCPGTGILLDGNEHIIEYNEMHDLALETGDVGAFYMGRDWTQRGNIIRYNYFHDLKGQGKHDVNAVYLDDWTSGTTVQGNIFNDCARGIMIGGGRDNVVNNNIFISCFPAIHVDSRGLAWAKYYFDGTDNILFERMNAMNFKQPPYSKKYPELLSLYNDQPAVAKNNKIYNNISYKCEWIDLLDDLNFKIVLSENNLIGQPAAGPVSKKDYVVKGNPGIPNYTNGDYQVLPEAMKYGFKKIEYNKIGLQKDIYRKDPSKSFTTR